MYINIRLIRCKGRGVPLQAWSDPEDSMKLRFPDFMTTVQDGAFTPRKCTWYSFLLEAESTPGAIVRSEGFYVNEKSQCYQLGSNQRPSDL